MTMVSRVQSARHTRLQPVSPAPAKVAGLPPQVPLPHQSGRPLEGRLGDVTKVDPLDRGQRSIESANPELPVVTKEGRPHFFTKDPKLDRGDQACICLRAESGSSAALAVSVKIMSIAIDTNM